MVRSETRGLRALTLGVVATLALAACGGSTPTTAPPASTAPGESAPAESSAPASEAPPTGGTIYLLTQAEQWDQIDPQRAYTGEDLAFFSATIYRSLTAYTYSADSATASGLQPDLATDTGTPS